jgi:hypothetical protein
MYIIIIFAIVSGSIGDGWINSSHAKQKKSITAGQYAIFDELKRRELK